MGGISDIIRVTEFAPETSDPRRSDDWRGLRLKASARMPTAKRRKLDVDISHIHLFRVFWCSWKAELSCFRYLINKSTSKHPSLSFLVPVLFGCEATVACSKPKLPSCQP